MGTAEAAKRIGVVGAGGGSWRLVAVGRGGRGGIVERGGRYI